ncbi:integrase [Streptomyces mirabilis]|uniref:integrase n=1 Tax=Streptomyces mirabilis TaxID=68239 RepID=UPI0034074C82
MTHTELLNLPVSFPLETANRALQLGRTTGYDLAKRGEYPVRVLRLGNAYRVTRADLLRYLGVSEAAASGSPGAISDATAA